MKKAEQSFLCPDSLITSIGEICRKIAGILPLGFIVTDKDLIIRYINQPALELIESKENLIVEKKLFDIIKIFDQNTQNYISFFQEDANSDPLFSARFDDVIFITESKKEKILSIRFGRLYVSELKMDLYILTLDEKQTGFVMSGILRDNSGLRALGMSQER
jgi:PAS domain-containing protein